MHPSEKRTFGPRSLLYAGVPIILLALAGGFILYFRPPPGGGLAPPPLPPGSKPIVRLEIRGNTLFLNPDDRLITKTMVSTGTWEPLETSVFLEHVKNGNTIVDVGANIGYYTVLGAQAVGTSGRVYAFEPDPTSFGFLRRNVKANGYKNVVLEQKALTNKPGTLRLYLSTSNMGDHRIYPTGDRAYVDVEGVRLDDYLEGLQSDVDFIKIDTQGAEVVILEGMKKTLERNRNVKLAIEFWPRGLEGFGHKASQLLEILEGHGFTFKDIDENLEVVLETTAAKLLQKYTVENRGFTNLFCTR